MTQNFSQVHSVDFIKTFILTIKEKLLRIFLVITTLFILILIQINIIRNYLKNTLRKNK